MICRVCLKEALSTLSIFDENLQHYNIAQILAKHLWFKPLPEDPISTDVCCDCWKRVNDFNNFYVQVEQAHKFFSKDKIDNDFQANEHNNLSAKHQVTETIYVKEELVENFCSENLELQFDKDSLNFDDAQNVKTEEENQVKNKCVDNFDNEFKGKKTGSQNSPLNKNTAKPKIHAKKRTTANEDDPTNLKQSQKVRKIQHNISQSDLDMIAKHIRMQCELCSYTTKNYNDFIDHYKNEHKGTTPSVKCCGRKLNRRFLFIQHAHIHEDPDHFKCKECNKSFSFYDGLRSHILENHAPKENLKYSCDLCPKRFSKQHYRNLHMASHIPPAEWKFLCEDCPQPKYFASNHLLQAHRNVVHIKAANVCHVCAKEIRDNMSFEKHVRSHFGDTGPRVKCTHPECDSYLKDEDSLRTHMKRHNDNGEKFICKHCNKLCINRYALQSHIHYVHSNKTYDCDICGKSFRKAITLKEHMAQHTGGVLYQCPFCVRTFNSNANMHSHKKKKHPVEYENLQRMKKEKLK